MSSRALVALLIDTVRPRMGLNILIHDNIGRSP